jgi:hypothetical protein
MRDERKTARIKGCKKASEIDEQARFEPAQSAHDLKRRRGLLSHFSFLISHLSSLIALSSLASGKNDSPSLCA